MPTRVRASVRYPPIGGPVHRRGMATDPDGVVVQDGAVPVRPVGRPPVRRYPSREAGTAVGSPTVGSACSISASETHGSGGGQVARPPPDSVISLPRL